MRIRAAAVVVVLVVATAVVESPASAATLPTGAVSLESTSLAGRYVRHIDYSARLDAVTSGSASQLKLDATWTVVNGLASPACYSFQAKNGQFLRHRDFRLRIDANTGMWSENDTRSEDYRVAYATGTSPLGPWTNRGVILQKSGDVRGPGHHSVVKAPNADTWYIAYHRFAVPAGNGTNREIAIDPMRFNTDGTIAPVVPTR